MKSNYNNFLNWQKYLVYGFILLITSLFINNIKGQPNESNSKVVDNQKVKDYLIPRIIEKNGRHALIVDGQPFLILGGQTHNSSGWPGMLPQVWNAIEAMHANTLEVPIYWEQVEPKPGKFAQARARTQSSSGLVMVCNLEKRKQSLYAGMDETRFK